MMEKKYAVSFQNETKQNIENIFDSMTHVEKSIATFFIENTEKMDFSSKNIARLLYVSEATLSRFSKKCGYRGYREFIYSYEKDLKFECESAQKVQESYQNLLQESYQILDEKQIKRIAGLFNRGGRVFVYGIGSSGYVAQEFQLRFMRIGLDVVAVTDSQMMQMSAALVDKDVLVIAISLSGKTKEIIESIKIAKKREATVIFITANPQVEVAGICDEVIRVASLNNLDAGTKISPQFSILVMIDVLYSYYFANDFYFKAQKYKDTLSAIKGMEENE